MLAAPVEREAVANRCLPTNRARAKGAGVRQKQSANCACWWLSLFPCAEPDPNVACHAAPAPCAQQSQTGQSLTEGAKTRLAEKNLRARAIMFRGNGAVKFRAVT